MYNKLACWFFRLKIDWPLPHPYLSFCWFITFFVSVIALLTSFITCSLHSFLNSIGSCPLGVFKTNDNDNNIDWKQKNGPSDTNDNSNNIDWKRKNGPSRRQENIYGALENINRPKRRNQPKRKSTSSSSLPPSVASPLPVSFSTKSVTSTPKLFVRTTTADYNNLRYKGNNVLIFFSLVELK